MSRRQMKKLQELKAKEALQSSVCNLEEESLSEDDFPVITTVAKNRFNLLVEDCEDNDSSEDKEGEESPKPEVAVEVKPEPSVKPKKKRKKKKSKQLKFAQSDTIESEDEVDASIREVNAMLGELKPPHSTETDKNSLGSPQQSDYDRNSILCSIDYKYFDAQLELQKKFGSDVISSNQANRKTQPNLPRGMVVNKKASLNGKIRVTRPYENYLSMQVDENLSNKYFGSSSSRKIVKFVHELNYQKRQLEFEEALMTMNQQVILGLIHTNPHHVDTLLQIAGFFRSEEDFTYADDLIERTIYEYEHSMMHSCRFHDNSYSFSYKQTENRGLFIALFQRMLSVARRRCHRTALELCKVLVRLSCEGDDPLAAMLLADTYALKSFEYMWLYDYYKSFNNKMNLLMMPNFAFSVPLAAFYLSRGEGNITAHKALKQRLLETQRKYTKEDFDKESNELLQKALQTFPEMLQKLASANSIHLSSDITCYELFQQQNATPALNLLYDMYALRSAQYWKEPEVLQWLQSNAKEVVARGRLGTGPITTVRSVRYKSVPVPIQRHVLLADIPELMQYLPMEATQNGRWAHHDCLPPSDAFRSYTYSRSSHREGRDGGSRASRGWVEDFLVTLLPDGFTPNPALGAQAEAMHGAHAAPVAAVAGPQEEGAASPVESLRSILESARTLIDSVLFGLRELNGEEELRDGEQWLQEQERADVEEDEDENGSRREDDFNEDQNDL